MMVCSLTYNQTSWNEKSSGPQAGSITTNKTSGGDEIPVELFQTLKDDAVKALYSTCQQIWKTQNDHRTGKGQFSFQSQRKVMPKKVQTTLQLCSFFTF